MLNQVTLLGRITRELELKKAPDNQSVLEFTLACESDQRSKEDKPDYINCEVWRGGADYLHLYATKGDLILAKGSIKPRYYEKDGLKLNKTVVLCNSVKIVSKKQSVDNAKALTEETEETIALFEGEE